MRPPFQNQHGYALEQERQRHDDAVHWFGEMTAFLLWWHIHDFENDLVERCSVCYVPYGDITDVYRQPAKHKCETCYGTTFEGGLRAILYRPAIWNTQRTDSKVEKRGDIVRATGDIQIVSSFIARDGDIAVRSDGTHWQMTQTQGPEVSTGFGPRGGLASVINGRASITLEDADSVSHLVTIDADPLAIGGWKPYMIHPHPSDVVNGPEIVSP